MSELKNKFRYWSYHRQHLGKQGTDVRQVLKDVIGVYSSHPTAPLTLYLRVQSFREQAFYQLDEKRFAFRVPAMRQSVYLLPKETAQLAMTATLPAPSDPYWQKRYSQKGRLIPQEHYEGWKEQIFQAADTPKTAAEIKQVVDIPDAVLKPLLNRMAFEGDLLRVGVKNLRSNIIRYVSTKTWAGEDFSHPDSDRSLAWLAGEYLRAFGPARVKDFQWWAGITAGKAKKAISAHETIAIENDCLLLAGDLKNFENITKPAKDTIDLLPQWDCYTMGYAPDGRERFVSPEMQDQIYGSLGATGGNALGIILVNGMAHGSWSSKFAGNKMKVTLKMFEKSSGQLKKDIVNQFNEMVVLLKAEKIILEDP